MFTFFVSSAKYIDLALHLKFLISQSLIHEMTLLGHTSFGAISLSIMIIIQDCVFKSTYKSMVQLDLLKYLHPGHLSRELMHGKKSAFPITISACSAG